MDAMEHDSTSPEKHFTAQAYSVDPVTFRFVPPPESGAAVLDATIPEEKLIGQVTR